jgi:hypothetical protein
MLSDIRSDKILCKTGKKRQDHKLHSKEKRNDKEMLEREQIVGRYGNNIVLNTKKNAKFRSGK